MKYILLFICLSSLSVAVTLSYKRFFYKDKIYASAKKSFQEVTSKTAKDIDLLVRKSMDAAESVAKGLTDGTITKKKIDRTFKKMLEENSGVAGGRIAFKPFTYDPKIKLYAAGWRQKADKDSVKSVKNDEIDDYSSCWYLTPMHEKINSWCEPYQDKVRADRLITYSAIFYRKTLGSAEKEPAGVVAVDISLDYLKKIIKENVEHEGKGFGALTTGEGIYLYHPVRDYVVSGKTLLDIAEEKGDDNRRDIAKLAAEGLGTIIEHTSTTTGEESWLMVEPIASSGWSVQNTFIKNGIEINTDVLRHQMILIILSGVISLISLFVFLMTGRSFSKFTLWLFVIFSSVILSAGIGALWKTALTYMEYNKNDDVEVKNNQTVMETMAQYTQRYQDNALTKPFFIPTGLYIESLSFGKANELSISGHIWRRYPADFPEALQVFQIFPATD
ncbi:MAG: hypothetical protein D3923_14640, partial [Candidatus Electrothrix sp. AR3]|nr:hypothetical protein [Candidatus Electrothrix sp. AR3]